MDLILRVAASVSAASPAGKGQKAIMDYLEKNGGSVELSVMVKSPTFRGMDFRAVQSAAEALQKKGLVKLDGSTISKK